jgi:uncharacterized heparinase superfamily protein
VQRGEPRISPPPALIPEMALAEWHRIARPFRVALRRNWFYRRLLKGPISDRVLFHPYDALPRKLEDAEMLLHGRFRFAGESVEVREGSIFEKTAPSQAWLESLHGFVWLPPLAMAGGEAARILASNLVLQWIKRNQRYSEPAWSPHVMGRRLFHIFAHGRILLVNSDPQFRAKFFVSLREQSRMLMRIWPEAPEGMARLEAAAALALSGACLDDSRRRLEEGLDALGSELARQIYGDGGHASRSPEAVLHAYRYLTMVMDALGATNHPAPQSLRGAHDRMAPMIRFFRHGDGALAQFHGGIECDAKMISAMLARDDVRGLPLLHAPHSAYQRLVAGRSYAVMDCGAPPPSAYSAQAHASCLAFELSAGPQRIVVNCGAMQVRPGQWGMALRATAAHSTMTLADTSSAAALTPGLASDLLGPRIVQGPMHVETKRTQTPQGWAVSASHDGYVAQFGIIHERTLTLSPQGLMLSGSDKLLLQGKSRRESRPFAIRFHIHPDVRISPSQGAGIILKLANGEGWRFRASGGQLAIEESVYLGSGALRKAEQIVVMAAVKDQPVEIGWLFEQIGAA